MTTVNLKDLIAKLDHQLVTGLEQATGISAEHRHYHVEIEQWLLVLLSEPNTPLIAIFQQLDINVELLIHDLRATVAHFKPGNGRLPTLAPSLVELLNKSWLIASLEYQALNIHIAHLLLALFSEDSIGIVAHRLSNELQQIDKAQLEHIFQQTTNTTHSLPVQQLSSESALARFTDNMTHAAHIKEYDPVIGRDKEIRQLIDILLRRRQNNPVLAGEAGVGKTAIVEGLAQRIAAKDVPNSLRNAQLHSLDLTALQAGCGAKGELEARLKALINEIQTSAEPVILFIDEIHVLMGASHQGVQSEAANLLKPVLARGNLRCIAATTWSEYKQYIEPDAAFTRRFELIKVAEPSLSTSKAMLHALISRLEKHHNVRIMSDAIDSAVELSNRYIAARHLPDKAISLLDTACARAQLSQASIPAEIESIHADMHYLTSQISLCQREQVIDASRTMQIKHLQKTLITRKKALNSLQKAWQQQQQLVKEINQLQTNIDKPSNNNSLRKLRATLKSLQKCQQDQLIVAHAVDCKLIETVVTELTGIPVGNLSSQQLTAPVIQTQLHARIKGQDQAIDLIAKQLAISSANIQDPHKPRGVFLLVGSSGIGKTETALTLANILFGHDDRLITINMSEFKEPHKISQLLGAPAGYVGYGKGGVLTEAVRRKPYSVILLDEMEKAHPSIQEVFFQVFDKGTISDGEGREIDFKNTVIIMTSNSCEQELLKMSDYSHTKLRVQEIIEHLQPALLKSFQAAFLGRVTTLPYFPLAKQHLFDIVTLKLDKIQQRVKHQYKISLKFDERIIEKIIEHSQCQKLGARDIDNYINQAILPKLSAYLLASQSALKLPKKLNIRFEEDQLVVN